MNHGEAKMDCHVVDEENGAAIIASFETVTACEAFIAELEKTDQVKVHRGGYGIDCPEHKLNPGKS